MRSLRFLDLSENKIRTIDVEDQPSLEHLELEGNPATRMTIKNLPKLRALRGEEELLASVSLSGTPRLSFCDLRYNKIIEIGGLERIGSLRHIYLSNNRIEALPWLRSLRNAQVLDISNNLFNLDAAAADADYLRRQGVTVIV